MNLILPSQLSPSTAERLRLFDRNFNKFLIGSTVVILECSNIVISIKIKNEQKQIFVIFNIFRTFHYYILTTLVILLILFERSHWYVLDVNKHDTFFRQSIGSLNFSTIQL